MPAISVIMPVYNSENYLRSAIDSVLNQTFRDFELILIDDGSKDGSGAICDEYGDKDSRVVVVHQENTGLCGARNRGLTMAQGEYLTFIDNDDLYMPTLLEDNYKLAVKHHAGMVKFGRVRADVCGDSLEKVIYVTAPNLYVYQGEEVRSQFFHMHGLRIFDYALQFDESMRFGSEDSKMTYQVYQHTSTLVINPQAYYIYFKRLSHSVSARFDQNVIDSLLIVSDLQYDIWQYVYPNGLQYSETIPLAMTDLITFAEKKRLLRSLKKHPAYDFPWNKTISKQVRAVSKTKWLMAALYAHANYGLLISLSKIYLRFILVKQRKTIRYNKIRFADDLEVITR